MRIKDIDGETMAKISRDVSVKLQMKAAQRVGADGACRYFASS